MFMNNNKYTTDRCLIVATLTLQILIHGIGGGGGAHPPVTQNDPKTPPFKSLWKNPKKPNSMYANTDAKCSKPLNSKTL